MKFILLVNSRIFQRGEDESVNVPDYYALKFPSSFKQKFEDNMRNDQVHSVIINEKV